MINFLPGTMTAKPLTRKKVLLIAVVAVLVSVAVGVVLWDRFYLATDDPGMRVVVVPIDEVQLAAIDYAESGDVEGGLAYYDSQIEQRKHDDEKRLLYIYKSNFALSVDRHEDAVNAATQADAIKSDLSTVIALADAYDGAGNKYQALKYYKEALRLAPKDGLASRSNYLWEQKVSELQR